MMIFMNTNPELQKVFEQNLTPKVQPEHHVKVQAKVPATQLQILSERLIPLISMIVLFGFFQVLSAIYYNPLEMSNGFSNMKGIAVVESDMPFAIQVRNTRVGQGMSRRSLAQKVGLSINNITAIEEGNATPTHEVETALCKVLGLQGRAEINLAVNW